MKCPKCGYLGFEVVDRCRNCGYEFALTASATPDLTLHAGREADLQPLVDLALVDAATADLLGEPSRAAGRAVALETPAPELPLFTGRGDDDQPLITRVSPPRPPLAVRRATPEVPRLRQEPRSPAFELPLPGLEPPTSVTARPAAPRAADARPATTTAADDLAPAPLTARAGAALVDLAVLTGIDALVVYFTMQICGITRQEIALLPKLPLLAFLLLQNISYFVAFTAGGQTLGKMLTGIRVVTAAGATPDLAQALRRTLVWLLLLLPAGLGMLTTLFDREHRGLHDRLAATRVVRAGA